MILSVAQPIVNKTLAMPTSTSLDWGGASNHNQPEEC